MKGFIHLIEIAMAAIIIVLSVVNFSYLGKASYERTNLIIMSDNIFNLAKGNTSVMDSIVPFNVMYGVEAQNYPKGSIKACCNCSLSKFQWLNNNLLPIYYNGRNINVDLERCSLEDYNLYDILFLVNYTKFSENKDEILNWTEHGKKVFAINNATDNQDFLDIFGLSVSGSSSDYNNFYDYDTRRLFQGIGYYIKFTYSPSIGKYQGYWTMWKKKIQVNKTDTSLEIEGVGSVGEGGFFEMTRSDGTLYEFKVKKIFTDEAWIQSVNTSNIILDFSGSVKVSGNNLVGTKDYGTLTRNGTAFWMSYFDYSDEYRDLLKAGFLVSMSNWVYGDQSGLSVTNFIYGCCDVPETGRIDLILKYKY